MLLALLARLACLAVASSAGYVSRSALDLSSFTQADGECPPCFNCLLPAFNCKQFGTCNESNGQCDCPSGFGGQDCSLPLCGSPADGQHRAPRLDQSCSCSEGWTGINCNVCQTNSACDRLMPDASINGTCYNGGFVVHENYQICDVTNRKIVDILQGRKPEVTFTCRASDQSCKFQFWVAEVESFYCSLSGCQFDQKMVNKNLETSYKCEHVSCACMPGRMLCGEDGSIDISDFLSEEIKGPGSITCPTSDLKGCKFHEPAMDQLISDVFGDDAISLNCLSGECLHESEIPGRKQPEKTVDVRLILGSLGGVLAVMCIAVATLWYCLKLRQYDEVRPGHDDELANKLEVDRQAVSLSFRDIDYSIGSNRILHGVEGLAQPGQLFAIMGASGAGKTSLLDVLARKRKVGSATGKMLINGASLSDSQFLDLMGFVDQEDALLPTLTAYETILYSALLRLPRTMPKHVKISRVIQIMEELGISHLKHSFIGENGARGISGGEKRRVSIACEMVTSPSILFLDEPTSGLDAYNAFNVISSLKDMATVTGRTIIFTIHQPRSNIVTQFDQLLLLTQGRLAYAGPMDDCVEYLKGIGHSCPDGYNIADFFIDLVSPQDAVRSATRISRNVSGSEQAALMDTFADSDDDETSIANQDDHPAVLSRKRSPITQDLAALFRSSVYSERLKRRLDDELTVSGSAATSMTSEHGTVLLRIGSISQFDLLARRTFKNLYRNPLLLIAHYAMATLLALLSGYLFFNISNDLSGFQNRLGLFFFILALFGFSTLTTLNVFAQERIIFMRERANGYYSCWTYFLAKVIFDMIPLRVLPPVLMSIVIYPMVGLIPELSAFLRFTLILVLFNLAAASVCLFLGVLIKETSVANLIGSLFMLFSLLFAGLLLNHDKIPRGLQWLQKLSIFHYAYEALLVNEVTYLTLTEKKYGLSIDVPGATILSTFGFNAQSMAADISSLGLYFLFFLVAAYLAMYYFLVERR